MSFDTMPWWVYALIGGAVILQLALQVYAIIDWVKRPAEGMKGNRIMWIVIILFGEILGALVYLLAARLPQQVDVRAPADPATSQSVVDALYGPPTGPAGHESPPRPER